MRRSFTTSASAAIAAIAAGASTIAGSLTHLLKFSGIKFTVAVAVQHVEATFHRRALGFFGGDFSIAIRVHPHHALSTILALTHVAASASTASPSRASAA